MADLDLPSDGSKTTIAEFLRQMADIEKIRMLAQRTKLLTVDEIMTAQQMTDTHTQITPWFKPSVPPK